jgi:Helix-turn-helix domain
MQASAQVFCSSLIDDFGLSASQFRLLHHLHRRCGKHGFAWCGIRQIARVCRMNKSTVIETVRELEELNVIACERREKRSSKYWINSFDNWKNPALPNGENCSLKADRLNNETVPQTRTGCTETRNSSCTEIGNKRLSLKGNPSKAMGVGTPKRNSKSSTSIARKPASVLSQRRDRKTAPEDALPWKLSTAELEQLETDFPRLDVKSLIRPAADKCREKFPGGGPMTAAFFTEYLRRAQSDLDPPGLIEARRLKEQLKAEPKNVGQTLSVFKELVQGLTAKTRAT